MPGETNGRDAEQRVRNEFAYNALLQRANAQNQLLWSTPPLALGAEAFLFVTSLDRDSTAGAKLVAGALGAVVIVITIQLMLRHRRYRDCNEEMLRSLATELGIPDALAGVLQGQPWYIRLGSLPLWVAGLSAFGFVNLGITAVAIWDLFTT